MLDRVNGRQAVGRVHPQELLEEVQSLWRQFSQVFLIDRLKVVDFRELHAQEARIFEEGFLVIGRESPQGLLDEEELVELVLPRKHGISID